MTEIEASTADAASPLASLIKSLHIIWEDLIIDKATTAITAHVIADDKAYFSTVHKVLHTLAYHDSNISVAATGLTSIDQIISSLPMDRQPSMSKYKSSSSADLNIPAERALLERAGLLRELCVQLQAERLAVFGRSKRERSEEDAEKSHVKYALRRSAYYLNVPFDANASVETAIGGIKHEIISIMNKEGISDIGSFQPKIFPQLYPSDSSSNSIASQFNGQQIVQLKSLIEIIEKDFFIRRSMLLKRLDVTMDTFIRSNKLSSSDNVAEMTAAIQTLRQHLSPYASSHDINDILNAPIYNVYEHSKKVTQTSNINKNKSFIKTLLIGSVPDRGGRVGEGPAPKKEAFFKNSWGNNNNNNNKHNNKKNNNKNNSKDNKKRERSGSQGSGGDDKKAGRVVTVA